MCGASPGNQILCTAIKYIIGETQGILVLVVYDLSGVVSCYTKLPPRTDYCCAASQAITKSGLTIPIWEEKYKKA